jgi:hypothetical protein
MVMTWDLHSGNASSSTWRNCSLCYWFMLAVFFTTRQVSAEVFTNSFLVRLRGEPGNEVAHRVANRNGFENLGPVSVVLFIVFSG